MSKKVKLQLGVKARDVVTGFEGIVTGQIRYLTGCDQFCLKPKAKKGDKMSDGTWFDENRIEVIDHGILKSKKAKDLNTKFEGQEEPEQQEPASVQVFLDGKEIEALVKQELKPKKKKKKKKGGPQHDTPAG